MQVQAYLNFGGRCEEALHFYKEAVGAEVIRIMRWKDSPDPAMQAPPDRAGKVMNAVFKIGKTTLMGDDGMGPNKTEYKGFTLSIEVSGDAEAKRIFEALSSGGSVQMALMKTFWTSSFGMFTDRFGVPWMVNVETQAGS